MGQDLADDGSSAGRARFPQLLQGQAYDPVRSEQVAGVIDAGNACRDVNVCITRPDAVWGQDDSGHAQGRRRFLRKPRYPQQAVHVRRVYAGAGRTPAVEIQFGREAGLPGGDAVPGRAAVAAAQG